MSNWPPKNLQEMQECINRAKKRRKQDDILHSAIIALAIVAIIAALVLK